MDTTSIVRMSILVIAVINAILNLFGFQTLPAEEISELVAAISVGVVSLYAAFKNNYLTNKGLRQKEVLKKENLTK